VKVLELPGVKYTERMTDAHRQRMIAQCIAGNEEAIEVLVREFEAGVFRLAVSILGDPMEAHEVTQETFLSALRALPTYQEKKSFKAWLYAIALNHSRSHLRKRKVLERLRSTMTTIFRVEVEKQNSPEEAILQSERDAAVWRAIQQLEEPLCIVLLLRYFQQLSIAEISEILSVPQGTIHSRLHTAREILRDWLKQLQGE
jgi:RNA polymerase sigma-70 factor (ECF subfamily)